MSIQSFDNVNLLINVLLHSCFAVKLKTVPLKKSIKLLIDLFINWKM